MRLVLQGGQTYIICHLIHLLLTEAFALDSPRYIPTTHYWIHIYEFSTSMNMCCADLCHPIYGGSRNCCTWSRFVDFDSKVLAQNSSVDDHTQFRMVFSSSIVQWTATLTQLGGSLLENCKTHKFIQPRTFFTEDCLLYFVWERQWSTVAWGALLVAPT